MNHPYDEIILKTATHEADEHPELSILFKSEQHEGGPSPHPYLPLKPLVPCVMKVKFPDLLTSAY